MAAAEAEICRSELVQKLRIQALRPMSGSAVKIVLLEFSRSNKVSRSVQGTRFVFSCWAGITRTDRGLPHPTNNGSK